MNGRTEHKIITEQKTLKKIQSSKHELAGFYNYMSSKYEHKTKELYVNYVIKFLDCINKGIKNITIEDVNSYLTDLTYKTTALNKVTETSGTYRATVHSALKLYFTYLESVKAINENIMKQVPRPKRKRDNMIERVYLEPIEVQTMINNVKKDHVNENQKNRDLLILMIFLYTGIRCTALTEINMSDVDREEMIITIIDKRNKKRKFQIDNGVIKLFDKVCSYNKLRKWKTDALFVSNRGNRISSSEVGRLIEKYTRNIQKKTTPHKLRRTFGTNMYKETGDIYAVKAALGHEDIRTTQIYVTVDDTEAAAKGMQAMKKNISF